MCLTFSWKKDTGEPGWWRGEIGGKEGVFPDNFVVMHTDAEKEVRSYVGEFAWQLNQHELPQCFLFCIKSIWFSLEPSF